MTSGCLDRKEVRHAIWGVHSTTDRPASGNTRRLFLTFGGPVCADRISNCPLDRVLTYKNLIYLLNLQFSKLKPYSMDTQDTPSRPRYQLTRCPNMFKQRKRCHDVMLSRQEGSMMLHLTSAQYWTGLAGGDTGCFFLTLAGWSAPTGLAIVHWIGY